MVFLASRSQPTSNPPSTISGINRLPDTEKRAIYANLIPGDLLERCQIPASLKDSEGRDLLQLDSRPGFSDAEIKLFHRFGFQDPVLYGHITDTISGQIHILLYIINDPNAVRYNIDQMPDGTPTLLGTLNRNKEEELRALEAGLAPGQIRHGLRLLSNATQQFEQFIHNLGHELYFVEPLYYHNAILFERMGFAYQRGRAMMEQIQAGFSEGGELIEKLNSSPFRKPEALTSVRLRSWAIHDGILGQPFSGVTMYKHLGKNAGISTLVNTKW